MSEARDLVVLGEIRHKIGLHCFSQAECGGLLTRMWNALYPVEVVTQGPESVNISSSLASIVNDKTEDADTRVRAAELLISFDVVLR